MLRKAACLGLVFLLTVSLMGILYVGVGGQLMISSVSLSANHQQITLPLGMSTNAGSMLMGLALCSHEFTHHHSPGDPPAVGRDRF
jgi:hypothetical protein